MPLESRSFLYLFRVLVILSFSVSASFAGQWRSSLLDHHVTFELPEDWVVQHFIQRGTTEMTGFYVPYQEAEKRAESANAIITAEPLQPAMDVQTFSDARLRNCFEGMEIIGDVTTRDKWRTVVWRAKQGTTPYRILDRFGVSGGAMVHFRLSFPMLYHGDTNWLAKVVSDFNRVVESLKIGDRNLLDCEVKCGNNLIWLGPFNSSIGSLSSLVDEYSVLN